jgi:hypothetical protein
VGMPVGVVGAMVMVGVMAVMTPMVGWGCLGAGWGWGCRQGSCRLRSRWCCWCCSRCCCCLLAWTGWRWCWAGLAAEVLLVVLEGLPA